MQVDPATATIVYVNTPDGNELTLDPGRQVVARVVSVDERGAARISLAGQVIDVQASAQLRVGQDVQLAVTRADADGVRLAIVAPQQAPNPSPPSSPNGLPQLIGELARAGVPVTAQVTQAVQGLMNELAGGGVTTGGGSSAARAIAALASRDIALSPAAAGRVAAALDLAGSMGPALADLAAKSSTVAAALPAGAPNAAAIRSLLAPGLSMTELAVARVVQAGQAAPAGANVSALPAASTNSAVIQNYVASQVASTAHLDDLASLNSLMGSASTAGRQPAQVPTPVGGALTAAAQDAALRGQSTAGQIAPGPTPATIAAQAQAQAQAQAATSVVDDAATAASTTTARSTATAAAATGAGSAIPTPTNAGVAQAVADLGALATRFAAVAGPAAGAAAGAAQQAGNATNSTVIAQQAGRDGSAGAAAASNAGASADGDPMPIVTAVQNFLASPRSESDAAKLLGSLQGSSAAAQQSALRMLPESQTLQLAGQLLDLLPDGAQLRGGALQELRTGVHNALDTLGRALAQPGGDDVSALRAALEQVASADPRPAVAQDAARILASLDGQQLLSRSASGADPGYVYFQIPMPNGHGAEVMVRREPGRRAVTFDEFNIAFLLDTEQLGTLMIQLDAHPASIRADVRTDNVELEPFLRAQSEALIEPLARESRRQVVVTTGIFEDAVPTSLLEPKLGLIPGANDFYA